MFALESPNTRLGRRASLVAVVLATLVTLVPFAAQADSPALTRPAIPAASGPVHDIPVGGALPSDATCAGRVVPTAENRPANVSFNNTRGVGANNENPRVNGNFVGTTDEILQWAACKWGMDVTWARNQAAIESFWRQSTLGDFGSDPSMCLPGHPIGADGRPGECPQTIGILQVRFPYHQSAFENNNAIRSTAYNADYAFSFWRNCFEGQYTWLNGFERGGTYAAGDGLGCMGVWFAGRWYTGPAIEYMNRLSTAGGGIPISATPRVRPPSAPSGLIARVAPTSGVGSGQVLLGWNLPTYTSGRAVTDYTIRRSSDGGRTWRVSADGVTQNRSFLISGLTNGHTYQFKVAAYTSAGWGPYSGSVVATPGSATLLAATSAAVVEIDTTTTVLATTTTTSLPPTTGAPTTILGSSTTASSSVPSTSAPTLVVPTTVVATTAAPTTAAPTTSAPTTAAPVPPPVQATNCPTVTPDDEQRVNNALAAAGLTIAVATAADDGATRYIVGSIYDSTGSRLSNVDTWVVIGAELLALSDGANQYSSGLADARAVLTGPNEGFNSPVQIDLATCATAALQGG